MDIRPPLRGEVEAAGAQSPCRGQGPPEARRATPFTLRRLKRWSLSPSPRAPPIEKFAVQYVSAHQTGQSKNLYIAVCAGPVGGWQHGRQRD